MSEPRAYYNEHDKYAAAWLRNLIAAGHIAPGDVDERDIRDVRPDDLRGYVQCHFFAGIGVWSHSLRRAGWPDRRHVWTASCPCQPFSAAGKGGGLDDERHLWPAFFHLVEQCGPRELFGEQVASKDGLAWLDLVQADMEGTGYAFGALDMCAAGFGAPHIRQRLYWVAYANSRRVKGGVALCESNDGFDGRAAIELADAESGEQRRPRQCGAGLRRQELPHRGHSAVGGLADTEDERQSRLDGESNARPSLQSQRSGFAGILADTDGRHAGAERQQRSGEQRQQQEDRRFGHNQPTGPVNGAWRDADWLYCRDAKWRPVRPGSFPLAHGAAGRVGRLRAYGNAIVAPQAEEFIGAYLDAEHLRLSLTTGIFA